MMTTEDECIPHEWLESIRSEQMEEKEKEKENEKDELEETKCQKKTTEKITMEGPMSQQESAKLYLQLKKIPEIFESLLAGLMLECPEDHMTYIDRKLELIKNVGPENIAWDALIEHLHPSRDPVRLELINEEDMLKMKCGYDPMTIEENYYSSDISEQLLYDRKSQVFLLTDPSCEVFPLFTVFSEGEDDLPNEIVL